MTILVFGRTGQLAQALLRHPWTGGEPVVALGSAEADIRDRTVVRDAMAAHRPRLIINAAAYTAVDKAESDMETAFAVNEAGTAHIAQAAQAADVPFIHVSTDYVFDGSGDRPWREDDATAPLGVYGASKLAGERAVAAAGGRSLILRTSWVFSADGANFVKTMLRLGADRPQLRVVADQFGRPTAASDIAAAIAYLDPQLGRGEVGGLLHFGGDEPTNWHGFAGAIFDSAARHGRPRPNVDAIGTADYPTPARRPANSVFDCGRFLTLPDAVLPSWRRSLDQVVDKLLTGV